MWCYLKMSPAVVLVLFSCFLLSYWHSQSFTAPTHPVYNICPEKVAQALQHFHRLPVPEYNKQPGDSAGDGLTDPAAASGSADQQS